MIEKDPMILKPLKAGNEFLSDATIDVKFSWTAKPLQNFSIELFSALIIFLFSSVSSFLTFSDSSSFCSDFLILLERWKMMEQIKVQIAMMEVKKLKQRIVNNKFNWKL